MFYNKVGDYNTLFYVPEAKMMHLWIIIFKKESDFSRCALAERKELWIYHGQE